MRTVEAEDGSINVSFPTVSIKNTIDPIIPEKRACLLKGKLRFLQVSKYICATKNSTKKWCEYLLQSRAAR